MANFASNAFLTRVSNAGTSLLYSTYLGGSGNSSEEGDQGNAVAVDSIGNVYLTGTAFSTNFPLEGAFQSTNKSASTGTAFVSKFLFFNPTTTTLTSSANPQEEGKSVKFTASVDQPGPTIPTGTIAFSVDGTVKTTVTLNSSGQATFTTTTLSVGSHTILATYSGSGTNAASSGSLTEHIAGPPASISVVSGSGQTGVYGAAFAKPLVAIVKDADGVAIPGTTVTFTAANLKFSSGSVVTGANGEVSVTATAEAAGTHTAVAKVSGTSLSVTFTFTINKAQLTVTANNASVPFNQAIPPLTYTVTGFVNGDTSSVVSGKPTETTTAKKGSPKGSYPITLGQGTLAATNYTFKLVNGTLKIT